MDHERTPIDRRSLLKRGALARRRCRLRRALLPALPAAATTPPRPAGSAPSRQHPEPPGGRGTDRHHRRADDGEPVGRPPPRAGWRPTRPILEEGRRRYGHRFRFDADNTQTLRRSRRARRRHLVPAGHARRAEPVPPLRPPRPRPRVGLGARRSATAGSSPPAAGTTSSRSGTTPPTTSPSTPTSPGGSRPSTATTARCWPRRTRTARTCTRRSRAGNKDNDPARRRRSATSGTPSGTGSSPRAFPRPTTSRRPARHRALGARAWCRTPARSPSTSRACQAGALPRVVFLDPGFTTDLQHRRSPRRSRHPGRPEVRRRLLLGVRPVAALGARGVRPHLRRVGRVLRPRPAADAARRPRQLRRHRELRAGGLPGADDPRVAVSRDGASSTTPCTTTRRSCGSSSGDSSARRPPAPAGSDGWFLTARDRNANNIGGIARHRRRPRGRGRGAAASTGGVARRATTR